MKPKNKYQKSVFDESRKLKPLTEAQRKSALRKVLPHLAKRNAKGECHCLECGGSWKTAKNAKSKWIVCPHCGTRLEVSKTKCRNIHLKDYFGVITRHNGYQVMRIYMIDGYMSKGTPARYSINEVFQRWIDKRGNSLVIGRKHYYSFHTDSWDFSSGMEIRNDQYAYTVMPCCLCGRMSVLPEIRRNGFVGNFHGISPRLLFQAILSDSRMETMLKAGQTELLRHFINNDGRGLDKLWPSVRICMRNHYLVKDAALWTDLISALEYCGKDLNCTKYICPDNLRSEHDRWTRKRQEKQAKERLERERQRYFSCLEQCRKDERTYKRSKGKFFDILISDGVIRIKVLDSVKAFYEEGALLHHCVAANKYYNKKDSLILSATIDGQPVETLEISLNTLEIIQCRGRHNQNSEHHERIMALMKANMNQIAKRLAA